MGFKKILIIQTDDVYFLHETLRVLEANASDLSSYELSVLASPRAVDDLRKINCAIPEHVVTDPDTLSGKSFDLSYNLSLNDSAAGIHAMLGGEKKVGAIFDGGRLQVLGLWSSWFYTFKGNTPFVTFHLREIYRRILGLQKKTPTPEGKHPLRSIVIGMSRTEFFPSAEQEDFITGIARRFPGIPILDESEVDATEELSGTLYVGPASLRAIRFSDAGAAAVVISSRFQGLNLLPESNRTLLLTSGGQKLRSTEIIPIVERVLRGEESLGSDSMNVYELSRDYVSGPYLERRSGSEIPYPFYQSHVVLWNYLLALQDVDLELTAPSKEQRDVLTSQRDILLKLIRLHDYAMVSLDGIFQESRKPQSDPGLIDKNLETMEEVDGTMEKISASNPFLRSLIDFYKLRKGTEGGESLKERAQDALLTYSEEHQALEAYSGLLGTILARK